MQVEVIRSPKRRKTAQARMVDGVLQVRIPSRASKAEEQRLVALFQKRFRHAADVEQIDLTKRARVLARRFDLPVPDEIRWVTNQQHRWGSCSPHRREIRITDRLSTAPGWVLDHVIVHELAHLVEADHGPAFHALVARNPLAERAEGYLLALSGMTDPTADPLADDAESAEDVDAGIDEEPRATDTVATGDAIDAGDAITTGDSADTGADRAADAVVHEGRLFDL